MAISEYEVRGIPELVTQVLEIRAGTGANAPLWFRGTPCGSWPLLPKLLRDGKSSEEYFERERRLITRFRQRSLSLWPAGYPQNDWEHLFAMQHYGVPTRLLDWSENLLVAAHFAFYEGRRSEQSNESDQWAPTIWCLEPKRWNAKAPVLSDYGDDESDQVLTTADQELEAYAPDTPKKRMATPVALLGAHNSERIVAQRGNFMVWGRDPRPLEEFARSSGSEEVLLWKVTLTDRPEKLFDDLQGIGFLETFVYPELSSVAAEISRAVGW